MPVQPNATVNEQISPDGTPTGVVNAPITEVAPRQEKPTEQPKPAVEPPPNNGEVTKVEEVKDVDLADFLKVKGEEVPAPKKEEKLEELETAPRPFSKTSQRDFTGIAESDIPLFKRMSNDAFVKMKEVYLTLDKTKKDAEAKEAALLAKTAEATEIAKKLEERTKGGIPDSYYEHPNAYILTPEFGQKVKTVQTAQAIYDHWMQQLQKIREGSTDFDVLNNDLTTSKYPADAKAEGHVISCINHAQAQLAKQRADLETMATQHSIKYKEASDWAANFHKDAFAIFDDPANVNLKTLADDTYNKFPPAFKTSPLSKILARSMVMNQQMATLLKSMQQPAVQQQTTTQTVKPDKAKAGPNNSDTGADTSGSENGEKEVKFDDFEKVKAGY